MLNRVTHQTVMRSTLANLQVNLGSMADLQARLSSGKNIRTPSDDPAGTADALRVRGDIRATTQYSRNADDGVGWLSTVDTALRATSSALRRARDLTVQGASTAVVSQASREALAIELEGIRDEVLGFANSQYLGRSVFAGTSDAGVAFQDDYTFTGTPGASVDRRVSPTHTVRADSDGDVVFGTGPGSVFALLDTIAADLRAGAGVTDHLASIDSHIDAVLGELAAVGARYGQMTDAQRATQDKLQEMGAQLSGIEDIDLAAVVLELKSQEVAYSAALGATARVLQPSLLDFLR